MFIKNLMMDYFIYDRVNDSSPNSMELVFLCVLWYLIADELFSVRHHTSQQRY